MIVINQFGIPDLLGQAIAPSSPPIGLAHPVWTGTWVSDPDRYAQWEYHKSIPSAVSPRQIRQSMNRTSWGEAILRDAVEAAVAAGDRDLKDWWEFSTVVERNNPQVVAMAAALGMDDSALDDLWRLAATL